jgi:hypothetical protein
MVVIPCANIVDPDQMVIRSGFTLFALDSLLFIISDQEETSADADQKAE